MLTDSIARDQPQTYAVTYKNAKQVRTRYDGISDMTLWRWLHDEELGFPKPIWIQGRRFWKESELVAWERKRPVGKVGRQALIDARDPNPRMHDRTSPRPGPTEFNDTDDEAHRHLEALPQAHLSEKPT